MSKTDWALSGVLASAAGAWLLLCAGCAYQGGGDLPGVAASEAALAAVRAGDTTIKFGPCSTSTANCTVVATTCTVDSTTTMCSTTGPHPGGSPCTPTNATGALHVTCKGTNADIQCSEFLTEDCVQVTTKCQSGTDGCTCGGATVPTGYVSRINCRIILPP